jgi:catechol 2,3-dioxygenase-like lactoylglutathione lyase family enzyme
MPGVSWLPVIPARISVITLGARDLDSLRDFYRGLGWKLAVDLEDFAAFETRGAVLTLYPLDALAGDAQVKAAARGNGMRGVTIAINVDRAEEVDETIAAIRQAGGRVTKDPVDAEWGGRSAYFLDPEDNCWEVAWVPPDSKMAQALKRAVRS